MAGVRRSLGDRVAVVSATGGRPRSRRSGARILEMVSLRSQREIRHAELGLGRSPGGGLGWERGRRRSAVGTPPRGDVAATLDAVEAARRAALAPMCGAEAPRAEAPRAEPLCSVGAGPAAPPRWTRRTRRSCSSCGRSSCRPTTAWAPRSSGALSSTSTSSATRRPRERALAHARAPAPPLSVSPHRLRRRLRHRIPRCFGCEPSRSGATPVPSAHDQVRSRGGLGPCTPAASNGAGGTHPRPTPRAAGPTPTKLSAPPPRTLAHRSDPLGQLSQSNSP